jgi:hypothetical protein
MKDAVLKIDVAASDRWLERCTADRSVSGTCVESD